MPRVEKPKKSRLSSRQKRVALVGAIVLAVLLLPLLVYGGIILFDRSGYEKASRTANVLMLNRKPGEGADVLAGYAKRGFDKKYRMNAWLSAGDLYADAKNYSAALGAYENAKAAGAENYTVATGAGEVAEKTGDKATAIKYYQQVIDALSDDKDPSNELTLEAYKAKVKYLEGE